MPANDAPYRQPAYLRDPAARSLDTELIAIGHDDRGSYLVLADTILYPEGGGQPADRGTVDGQPIGDVQRVAGEIRHYLTTAGAPLAAGPVSVALDWPRRWDHMQQHSAQHLPYSQHAVYEPCRSVPAQFHQLLPPAGPRP